MGRLVERAQFTKIGIWLFIYIICLGHGTVSGKVTFGGPIRTYKVEEGKDVSECCKASCSNGTCSYNWKAIDISGQGNYMFQGDCVIMEPAMRSSDDSPWNFVCVVRDTGDDHEDDHHINIDVLYPPDVTVREDHSHLECIAKGNPKTYTFGNWTQTVSGVVVRTTSGEKVGSSTLLLPLHSTYEDFGAYDCSVNNGVANANDVLWQKERKQVVPEAIPKILTPISIAQNVSKGETFSTQIDVFSAHTRNYKLTFIKEGSQVNADVDYVDYKLIQTDVIVSFYGESVHVAGTQIHLTIESMEETYFGEYKVAIGNGAGEVNVSAYIHPQGPPDAPIEFAVTAVSHDSATFHVTSGFYNGGNQTLVIEYRVNEIGSQWTMGPDTSVGSERNQSVIMRVEGLESSSAYFFRAYSYNEFNKSREAETLYIETESDPLYAIGGGVAAAVAVVLIIPIIFCIVIKWKKTRRERHQQPLPEMTMNNTLLTGQDHTDSNGCLVYENTEVTGNGQPDGSLYENIKRDARERSDAVHEVYANVSLVTPRNPKTVMKITDDSAIYLNTNQMAEDVLAAKGQSSAHGTSVTEDSSYANVIIKVPKVTAVAAEEDDDYLDMDVNSKVKQLKVSGPKQSSMVARSKTFSYSQDVKSSFDKSRNKSRTKKEPVEEEPQEPRELYIEFNPEARESVPDFPAPPPPGPHRFTSTNDYVNTKQKGKRSF